ncbi:hypothetical protein V8C42DRAFT_357626 [Trichoderma barbatum]
MQIRSPPRLTSNIDIVDTATSIHHSENQKRGALVSIDLNCPADLFYGRKSLIAKFSLSFTTLIQDGFQKSIAIQHAKVNYFRADNDIEKLLPSLKPHSLEISGAFNDGKADIEIPPPNSSESDNSSKVRIVVHLDAYPSKMEVSACLSTKMNTSPTSNGNSRPSRSFASATHPLIAQPPSEERLRGLLCWTAALGYETLFGKYLDQEPSILDMEDEFGMTPFSWAALAGQASVTRLALRLGGCNSARKRTKQGPSPLEAAARSKDAQIFESFLSYLKDLERSTGATPESEEVPGLDAKKLEDELNTVGLGDQTAILEKLIDMLLLLPEVEKEKWLASQMVKAAKAGALNLVQVLKSRGAKVDSEVDVEVDANTNGQARHRNLQKTKTTPLMSAIEENRTNFAEFLIIHGAGTKEELRIAVLRRRYGIIRALLRFRISVEGKFKKELCAIAKKDRTTLKLLAFEKGTGRLATSGDLHKEIDELFEATVVEFFEGECPSVQELSVTELMGKRAEFFSLSGEAKFKWFHLPANNMKWAEALFDKIYHEDPSSVHKVLDPKRWVKRQHEGERDSPQARFMMPACHDFTEDFKDKMIFGDKKNDKHLFLFMPYLHWDEENAMQKRSKFLSENSSKTIATGKESKEEMLLWKYLLSESHCDANSRHVLHIRRTLDQYLYHNLKDTKIRDADQTVHRYQNKLNKDKPVSEQDPLTVIMVDQLWLWILVDTAGKAKAIVTCFPSRDWLDVGMEDAGQTAATPILDQRRTTDVLQSTSSYILYRPSAIKTPYDLAGVIASRCSRALLDHSADMLNFGEVYENSISSIMDEETLLFNRFNTLMRTRTQVMDGLKERSLQSGKSTSNEVNSYQDLAKRITEDKEWLQQKTQIPDFSVEHCQQYRSYTLETEIPSEDEIKKLEMTSFDKEVKEEHLVKLLEKFGRFYVLDITREITLLSQIKDIQDELEMMIKVFADQKEALEAMDRIIRTMQKSNSDPNDDEQTEKLDTNPHFRRATNGSNTTGDYNGYDFSTYDDSNSDILFGNSHQLTSNKEHQNQDNPAQSMIWGLGHQKQNLPLRTVLRHSEQINNMLQRAKTTNAALNSLVDLKQKQNNMIDTRTARLQAEQSYKMTLETEKQGRTLMVFTIVTIVFLPLSFIAAFFAIPTKEFDNNTLTLGFVSKITFPASAAVSLLIIVVGYSASQWPLDKVTQRVLDKIRSRGSKSKSDSPV